MATLTCPRCRTRIDTADASCVGNEPVADAACAGTTLRCPKCGVHTQVAMIAKQVARPSSTRIAAGPPAPGQSREERPESVLDGLTAHLRHRRHTNDYPESGGGDEAECRRRGWWWLLFNLLPFIVVVLLVTLAPAAIFAAFARIDPETVGLRDLLILCTLIAVPLLACAGFVWLCVRRSSRDDEDEAAPC